MPKNKIGTDLLSPDNYSEIRAALWRFTFCSPRGTILPAYPCSDRRSAERTPRISAPLRRRRPARGAPADGITSDLPPGELSHGAVSPLLRRRWSPPDPACWTALLHVCRTPLRAFRKGRQR